MSEPSTHAQLSFEDGHDIRITGESCNAFDEIYHLDLDVNQNELDEIVQNYIKCANNTLHEANENEMSFSVDEITCRNSKVPEHKLRCNISTSHFTEEEARALQNDNKEDSTCNTATKFSPHWPHPLIQKVTNTLRLSTINMATRRFISLSASRKC